jgi:DNA glycosylase AlkZ-like
MDIVQTLRAWTCERQRLGKPARTPEDALRSVVAVYATHPTCPLALAVRTRSLTADRYRRIDRSKKGVRIPAMRKTLFLVPAENASRIFSASKQPSTQIDKTLARTGLSKAEYARLAQRVLAAAEEPKPARELESEAGVKGGRLGAVLRSLRYEGRLLALATDALMSGTHRYVATTAWLDDQLDGEDRDEALSWLAGEYLRGYGPARAADLAWWAGITKGAAKKAIDAHETVDVDDGLLLLRRDEAAFGRVKRLHGTVDLLPKWDAYTMGYAPDGRHRFVHPDVQREVYTPIGTGLSGDGNPVILVDGEVAGLWTYSLKEGPHVEPFDRLGPKIRRQIDERLAALVHFLSE